MIRFWIFFLMWFVTSAVASEEPSAIWGIEKLMQQRTQVHTGRASFVEIRKMPSINTTTTSSGLLIYRTPDFLERQISKPFPERATIQGDRLTLETETASGQHTQREFTLTDLPGLRPFFIALRAILAGDLETLQRDFEITFNGSESSWQLKLIPRNSADQHVHEISVSGRALHILLIEVHNHGGDSTRTTLTPEPSELPPSVTPTEPES